MPFIPSKTFKSKSHFRVVAALCFVAPAALGQPTPVDFGREIWPIFEATCIKCHGHEEQEEDLRLDSVDAILHGSKFGEVIVPGDPDESELIRRISLPADDKEVMPEEGQTLPPESIALILRWVEEGAKFGDWVPPEPPEVVPTALELLAEGLSPAPEEALARLEEMGALAMPLDQHTPLLQVNFHLTSDPVSNAQLGSLDPLKDQITWLNLAGAAVTDEGLARLTQFSRLTRLHLEKTSVGDAGLEHLKDLEHLEYLNLYGTRVSDEGLAALEKIESLRKVFLWQTQVTPEGAQKLREALPGVEVNTGVELQTVAKKPAADFASFAALFDEGSCCAEAHAEGHECDHACCQEALAKAQVCLECNPGAGKKLLLGEKN